MQRFGQDWHSRLRDVEVRMSNDQGCASDLIVRAEDWPHGLRCGECRNVLLAGDRYAERLTGMVGKIPAVMIVCRPCDGAAHDLR